MPVKKKKTIKKKTIKKAKKQPKRLPKRKTTPTKSKKKQKSVKSKKITKRRTKPLLPANKVVGKVTHYFPKVNAAVIKMKSPINVGENIWIKGHTTDFKQGIVSMEIEHVAINSAKKGDEIGLLVNSRVRQGDIVYKL